MNDFLQREKFRSLQQSFLSLQATSSASRWLPYVLAGIVVAAIAIVYWPVVHASFVWDDWQSFHDTPWLTRGDNWKHYILKDFNSWAYYFRPLSLVLFMLQVRAFDSTPAPMHVISLMIHLVNVALVGKLAWHCATLGDRSPKFRTWGSALCMALYGLHPALIETVSWIGCQFDLVMTMLTLLGLIANLRIQHRWGRAALVSLLFFLAACTKESAISFPLLLVLFDWLVVNHARKDGRTATLGALLSRNWPTYAGVLVAGVAYLIFRRWALGSLTNGLEGFPISMLARLQVIGYIYFHYWKIIFWPVDGMNPIHPFNIQSFTIATTASVTQTTLAVGTFIAGLYLCIRRSSPWGYVIMGVTAALLPVLQVIPGHFERSLYHERYATAAVAVLCAMLPLLRLPGAPTGLLKRRAVPAIMIVAFLWLSFSIVTIRAFLPMWSNDINLWRWAISMHPHAPEAKADLINAYVREKDFADLTVFADSVLADPAPCIGCMIHIAELALENDDLPRANKALYRAARSSLVDKNNEIMQTYYGLSASLLLKENRLDTAEDMAHKALAIAPKDVTVQKLLKDIEARKKASSAQP
ncbi:tetratricopeptide repeat protein [Dyella acidiphila]|uniref:Tetratricopeptide repeat protein n=1 Tax=Dyella acidiphila TaxID=2775866 RepID=A0ABR9G8T6_9GAMM|nr:hypothetical protein [Dyella acidiphila]MBE1160441.1 hypothetical protein [Dyella acidiphila]